jgi:hypothetical protein
MRALSLVSIAGFALVHALPGRSEQRSASISARTNDDDTTSYFPGGDLASNTLEPWSNYNDNAVWYPWENNTSWRSLYARAIQLPDLSILLTYENYQTTEQHFWPILRSTDGGATFEYYSRVNDQVNGWGTWWNPNLFILPQALGGFPAGTILIAGESLPTDFSKAYIDLYASTDSGQTWEFVSHIVYGPGPETVRNGDKAVWEPFLMVYQDQLICVYSDQRDPNHAQKVSLVTSTDLRNWGSEIDLAAFSDYNQRPGMGSIAYSPKSQKYVMTFEYCGGPLTGGCPVYYKVSDSPLTIGDATAQPIINNGNDNPNGSPFIIYVPNPDASDGSGMFLMTGGSKEPVFTNGDDLDPNGWVSNNVGQWSAYSRQPLVIDTPTSSAANGQKKLFISNGGNIGCEGTCHNYVADGLVDIPPFP